MKTPQDAGSTPATSTIHCSSRGLILYHLLHKIRHVANNLAFTSDHSISLIIMKLSGGKDTKNDTKKGLNF